jgi:hypothetical protein
VSAFAARIAGGLRRIEAAIEVAEHREIHPPPLALFEVRRDLRAAVESAIGQAAPQLLLDILDIEAIWIGCDGTADHPLGFACRCERERFWIYACCPDPETASRVAAHELHHLRSTLEFGPTDSLVERYRREKAAREFAARLSARGQPTGRAV